MRKNGSRRKRKKKIIASKKTKKNWNEKVLTRVPKRKGTRTDGSWMRKSVSVKDRGSGNSQ